MSDDRICTHRVLARQCRICEVEAERDAMRDRVAHLEAVIAEIEDVAIEQDYDGVFAVVLRLRGTDALAACDIGESMAEGGCAWWEDA